MQLLLELLEGEPRLLYTPCSNKRACAGKRIRVNPCGFCLWLALRKAAGKLYAWG